MRKTKVKQNEVDQLLSRISKALDGNQLPTVEDAANLEWLVISYRELHTEIESDECHSSQMDIKKKLKSTKIN